MDWKSLKKKNKLKSLFFIKLINNFIKKGKKERIFLNFIYIVLKLKIRYRHKPVIQIFNTIFKNISPVMFYKKLKVKNKTIIIPFVILNKYNEKLAVKFFVDSVNKRKELNLFNRIIKEFEEIYDGKGLTVKAKKNLYEMVHEARATLHRL